ncbi:hypothetical protein XELAEV_18046182mg, partial [Xenopus laevis]
AGSEPLSPPLCIVCRRRKCTRRTLSCKHRHRELTPRPSLTQTRGSCSGTLTGIPVSTGAIGCPPPWADRNPLGSDYMCQGMGCSTVTCQGVEVHMDWPAVGFSGRRAAPIAGLGVRHKGARSELLLPVFSCCAHGLLSQ